MDSESSLIDLQGSWHGCCCDALTFSHLKISISGNNFECWEQITPNCEEPLWSDNSDLSGKFFLRDYHEDKNSFSKYFRLVFFPNDNISTGKVKKGIDLSNKLLLVEGIGLYLFEAGLMTRI